MNSCCGSDITEVIKYAAKKFGADLVGIADAEVLNSNPPDPNWPQTPERVWKECKSLIVIAKHLPWGVLRVSDLPTKLYAPHLVMSKLDKIALELTYYIEELGFKATPIPQNYTDPELKRATYGSISLRHAAVEAGLGTLGLNLNLITREFGPRVYLQAVLTDMPLTPDNPVDRALCLGPKCGRCLLACPANAVGLWNLDKRKCSRYAQRYGISALMRHISKIIESDSVEEMENLIRSMDTVNFWQALRTGAGAYGGCLRCWEVCPVGDDYKKNLGDVYGKIDSDADRRVRLKELVEKMEHLENTSAVHSLRWIGRLG